MDDRFPEEDLPGRSFGYPSAGGVSIGGFGSQGGVLGKGWHRIPGDSFVLHLGVILRYPEQASSSGADHDQLARDVIQVLLVIIPVP